MIGTKLVDVLIHGEIVPVFVYPRHNYNAVDRFGQFVVSKRLDSLIKTLDSLNGSQELRDGNATTAG